MRESWRSVNAAMAWAYAVLDQDVLQRSSTHELIGGERDGPRADLTPYERHAQAALIVAPVESMTSLERSYCRYRWGRIDEQDPDWQCIYDWVRVKGGWAVAPRRGLWKLMRVYRGEKIGTHALRRDLGCAMGSVMDYKDRTYAVLNALDDRVRPQLEEVLYSKGLVELG